MERLRDELGKWVVRENLLNTEKIVFHNEVQGGRGTLCEIKTAIGKGIEPDEQRR